MPREETCADDRLRLSKRCGRWMMWIFLKLTNAAQLGHFSAIIDGCSVVEEWQGKFSQNIAYLNTVEVNDRSPVELSLTIDDLFHASEFIQIIPTNINQWWTCAFGAANCIESPAVARQNFAQFYDDLISCALLLLVGYSPSGGAQNTFGWITFGWLMCGVGIMIGQ